MISRAQISRLRSLHRKKGRTEHGLFLAEGPRLARELLASPVSPMLLVYTADAAGREPAADVIAQWADRGLPSEQVDQGVVDRIADAVTPQGIVAVGRMHRWGWQDLTGTRILVLDGVQDPGNTGTLFRLAEALGVDGLVCLTGTADPWSPKVVRSSAGSVFRLPYIAAGWAEARGPLLAAGRTLWAAASDGEPFQGGDAVPARWALVLGNEAAGISPEVRKDVNRVVSITLAGGVESLNVAMAGALLLDRITRGAVADD